MCLMSRSKSRRKKGVTSPDLTLVSVSQALLVGEHLSFRRVATVLGVRQSAVSRRVRELEDELGVSLFERHHAGVRVTNAGARFLQDARAALLQLDHAVKTAAAAGSGTIGRLTRRLTGRNHHAGVQKLNVGRDTLMHLVAMGLGVSLTSEATIATPFPKVVFRAMAGDDELIQFSAAWLPHNDNPALRRFLSLARTLAKEWRRHHGAGPTSLGSAVIGGLLLSFACAGALARRLGLST